MARWGSGEGGPSLGANEMPHGRAARFSDARWAGQAGEEAEAAGDLEDVDEPIEAFRKELLCSLCDRLFDSPCTLSCGHTFCRGCAAERLHGKGVYKNECPDARCTNPVFCKDLVVNQTLASVCHMFQTMQREANAWRDTAVNVDADDVNNVNDDGAVEDTAIRERERAEAETVSDAILPPRRSNGDAAPTSTAEEERETKRARPSPEHGTESDAMLAGGERAQLAPPPPELGVGVATPEVLSEARCRQLAAEVGEIDDVMAFIAQAVATLEAKRRVQKEEVAVGAAAVLHSTPPPPEAGAAVTLNAIHTVPPQHERRDDDVPKVPQEGLEPQRAPKPPGQLELSDATQTQSQVPRFSQALKLTAAQSRRLYTAAHGQPPRRNMSIKALRATIDKLDPDSVAAAMQFALGEDAGGGDGVRGDGEVKRRRRQTAAVTRTVDAAAVPGKQRRSARRRPLGNVNAMLPPQHPVTTGKVSAAAVATRVFIFTSATGKRQEASMKSKMEAARNKAFAADIAKVVARSEDDVGGAVFLEEREGIPPGATHLLMDVGEAFDVDPASSSRLVKRRTVRYLEAILRGCWVLHVHYLHACAEAGTWLPEHDFELRDAGREAKYTGHSSRLYSPHQVGTAEAMEATAAALELGPPGGRRRTSEGREGVFMGEVVKVMPHPDVVAITNSNVERLLELGGARVVRDRGSGEHTVGRNGGWHGSRAGDSRGRSRSVGGSGRPSLPPTETEQIPDSEDEADDGNVTPGMKNGSGSGGGGGDDGGRMTAIVMPEGSSADAIRTEEARWGARAVEFRWVTHSIVHHTALPKDDYYLLPWATSTDGLFELNTQDPDDA